MNITCIVDHQAKGKGLLVTLVFEPLLHLGNVGRRAGHRLTLQEGSQFRQCIDNVDIAHLEVWIISNCRASLIQVGLIDEVPVTLRAIALAFDIVGKSGTLSERVLVLIIG